jgi:hypothetical protein
MNQTLQEVKSSKSNFELVNKHCFFFATIYVGLFSSMSGIVRILGLDLEILPMNWKGAR